VYQPLMHLVSCVLHQKLKNGPKWSRYTFRIRRGTDLLNNL
jgi:hypothetical protein